MKEREISRRRFLELAGISSTGIFFLKFPVERLFSQEVKMQDIRFEDHFEIDKDTIRKLLDLGLSKGADFSELYMEYTINENIFWEDQILKDASKGISRGIGIRVIKEDSFGYAFSDDISFESLKNCALTAAEIASGSAKVKSADLSPKRFKNLYPVKELFTKKPVPSKIDLLKRADDRARKYDPCINKVSASFMQTLKFITIVNSEGLYVTDAQPLIRFGISTVAEKNGKKQRGSRSGGGRIGMEYFIENPPEKLAKEASEQAVKFLDAKDSPAGKFPVVLAPGWSGILLHEAVGHGLEADFNRKKESNYSDRIGDKVASELCTVIDDGTIMNQRGSINCDDEGNKSNKTVLIENGILKGYMHDRISSKYFKVNPTGNGRRESYKQFPIPRMTNTYLLAGKSSSEEIISSVDYGIYTRNFSGGQVNISNGDFVFSAVESYLIEKGKITAPLKGVTLIGNGPDVLTRVKMVGNDFLLSDGVWTCGKNGQSVPVGVGLPTVKISEITVGGTKV
ncbi:MAG: metallopeptidase TldD-related protein [Acidobacteriota bacterium]